MRTDEEGGPTHGQPSTLQNHRFLELERPQRIIWPNPLTPKPRGSQCGQSHLVAGKPEVPGTLLPALLWTTPLLRPSHSSRAFRKENQEGKSYTLHFMYPPAFNKEADGVNGRHEAPRRPGNNPAPHAEMLTTSSPVCTCSTSSYNVLLLQWVLKPLVEKMLPAYHWS